MKKHYLEIVLLAILIFLNIQLKGDEKTLYDYRKNKVKQTSELISDSITANVQVTNVNCYGGNDGLVVFGDPIGGTAPYEYSIDNGTTWTNSQSFLYLAPGTYYPRIREKNNPSVSANLNPVLITEPMNLSCYVNIGKFDCSNRTWQLQVSVTGGTKPYKQDPSGLHTIDAGGSRTFMVVDANGCQKGVTVIMPDSAPVVVNAVSEPPTVCGANATLTISASGGSAPYFLNGNSFTSEISIPYPAGSIYSLVIEDSNGCQSNVISGVTPQQINGINISGSITEIDYKTNQLGSVNLTVEGGNGEYVYVWSNGASTKDINGLEDGGVYTVTITDSNGCTATQSFRLKEPNYIPIANAGADQIVYEGVTVTLDGSESSDKNGDKLTYHWSAPTGIYLSNANTSKPSFLAPEVPYDTILSFSLVVNDGINDSEPDTAKIAIQNIIHVGVNSIDNSTIKIFPNPTSGIINVDLQNSGSAEQMVCVFSSVGSIVFKKNISNANIFQIDLSNQPDGIYLLKIISGKAEYLNKLIIIKK